MSITQNIHTNKFVRKIKKATEMICRIGSGSRVYFPYKNDLIHPAFDELKKYPPLKYVNKYDANLLHLVMGGSPEDLQKDHIIEIIDHAFSVIAIYEQFPREPIEYYKRQEKIREIYLSKKLKKLIFISKGQLNLFKYYFDDNEILNKAIVIPIPWRNNIELGRNETSKNKINFLFIASNYYMKGVEIVLNAWNKFIKLDNFKKYATLTLVSHDIPHNIEQNLDRSVKLIKQIPLNIKLKNNLYKHSDVVLALTLTDGLTAIEATSYCKPIVVFRTQHSKDFIDNDNGYEIDVPINVYDVDKYGIVWKTKKDFDLIVKRYLKDGLFNKTIEDLVNIFIKYTEDRELLKIQMQNAEEKYYRDYRVEDRNRKLLEIYNELI